MNPEMSAGMMRAANEVVGDLEKAMDADDAASLLPIVQKYASLVFMRDELPKALLALQFHTTTPKGKEALAKALRILAHARGVELPESEVSK